MTRLNGAVITSKLYQENNACSDCIRIISYVIEQEVMSDVKLSPSVVIMIDESTTGLSTQKQLFVLIIPQNR